MINEKIDNFRKGILVVVFVFFVFILPRKYHAKIRERTLRIGSGTLGSYPDELEFISLFNTEPKTLDKNTPFYYNQSWFSFQNDREAFFVKMSPSLNEFELKVISKENGELFNYYSFKTVGKVEF